MQCTGHLKVRSKIDRNIEGSEPDWRLATGVGASSEANEFQDRKENFGVPFHTDLIFGRSVNVTLYPDD
jgi:hypothetical protein